MSTPTGDHAFDEWPRSQQVRRTPYGTMLLTILLLAIFVVAVVVVVTDPWGTRESGTPEELSPEEKLLKIRAHEREVMSVYEQGSEPGKYVIPLDRAVERSAEIAGEKGELPFPLPAKKEE